MVSISRNVFNKNKYLKKTKLNKHFSKIFFVYGTVIVFLLTPNVKAITSEEVTYDKNGEEQILTGSLDELYTELNICYTKGDATSNDIVSGKSAYVKGKLVNGSMPKRLGSSQATKVALGAGGLYMVFPYGYYPAENHFNEANSSEVYISNASVATAISLTGSKIAQGQSILGVSGTYTSDATANANQMLSGVTAYVRGNKITGTIGSKGAVTITPGTTNQTIGAGQYLSGAQTIKGDGNLTAGNIKSGVSIFGVSGTFTADATATSGDIASGKTAYVKGQKVTGTAGNYKVYKMDRREVTEITNSGGTVPTFKSTAYVGMAKADTYTSFTIDLGFTPTEVVDCNIKLKGDGEGNVFRLSRREDNDQADAASQWWHTHELTSDMYLDTSVTNNTNYSFFKTKCEVNGSKLTFRYEYYRDGNTLGRSMRAKTDKFYISGTLTYR